MSLMKLDTNNFDEVISSSNKPVLVDFYADWCPPCKMIGPIVEEIANENSEVQVCKINIDDNPDIAERFSVQNIPTLVSFKDGKEYKRTVGAAPKDDLLDLLK